MLIEFLHTETDTSWTITSPQLPGWICCWPDKETAFFKCPDSLRAYLRRERARLSADIIEEIRALVASAE